MKSDKDILNELQEAGFGEVKDEQFDAHDFNVDNLCKGILIEKKSDVGPNNSMLYVLEVGGGKKVSVWGSTIIDSRLKNVELGEEIVIWYLGKAEGKKGTKYHNYRVFHQEPVAQDK